MEPVREHPCPIAGCAILLSPVFLCSETLIAYDRVILLVLNFGLAELILHSGDYET